MKVFIMVQRKNSKIITIIDDEPDILELVRLHLEKAGFTVKAFEEVFSFLDSLDKYPPELIILDLMLPGEDGLEICKRLKTDSRTSAIPIIMLTARSSEADKIVGLELGADDYVTKPFSPGELVARVKAVIRRGQKKGQQSGDSRIRVGELVIDVNKFQVRVAGKRIELTSTEFKILQALAYKKGWVLNRNQLLDILWGDEKIVIDRTIDVHIAHLRNKLGEAGKLIKNIRGIGYKIEDE